MELGLLVVAGVALWALLGIATALAVGPVLRRSAMMAADADRQVS